MTFSEKSGALLHLGVSSLNLTAYTLHMLQSKDESY